MSIALAPRFSLSDDEFGVAAARTAIHEFPTVLAVRPRHGGTEALDAARDVATRGLVSRGLIIHDVLAPDLVSLLSSLSRPDRELAMRVVTPDGIARVSMVRRAALAVLARRVGDEFMLCAIEHGVELRTAAAKLVVELPRAEPARINPVGAPLDVMTECLNNNGRDGRQLADRIHALGADPRSALLLGSALASRVAFAEIVYYPLAHDDGRISRTPGAVAVFYTKRGRIVAAPSASPSGELWITFKPGSDHAIAQAIGQLIGLSPERWEEE